MVEMFLGHLLGDYLLQNHWMATNKAKFSLLGWMAALVHTIVYTLSVCLLMMNFDPLWMLTVFISHFFIDKFALGATYMKYIKGEDISEFLDEEPITDSNINYIKGGILSIIYVVTDNSMHLILMWLGYNLIY